MMEDGRRGKEGGVILTSDKEGDASLVVFECLPPHPFINLSYVSSSFISSLDENLSFNT